MIGLRMDGVGWVELFMREGGVGYVETVVGSVGVGVLVWWEE